MSVINSARSFHNMNVNREVNEDFRNRLVHMVVY